MLNNLEKITPRKDGNYKMKVSEQYPCHTIALTKSGMELKTFPTSGEFWEKGGEFDKMTGKKGRRRRGGRVTIIFVMVSQKYGGKISILSSGNSITLMV